MRRRPLLGVAAAALLASLAACGDGGTATAPDSYRPGPGQDQVTVTYRSGPDDGQGVAEILSQDSSAVVIRVTFARSSGVSDAVAVQREAVATLEAPLGSRRVLDQDGKEVRAAST